MSGKSSDEFNFNVHQNHAGEPEGKLVRQKLVRLYDFYSGLKDFTNNRNGWVDKILFIKRISPTFLIHKNTPGLGLPGV